MSRIERDFFRRTADEQTWMLQNTWCDECAEADIGMSSPREYNEDGTIYVEGQCNRCKRTIRSSVYEGGVSKQVDTDGGPADRC